MAGLQEAAATNGGGGCGLCASGHPLIATAATQELKCDKCGAEVPVGGTTYSCVPCDFDQCLQCGAVSG